MMTQGSFLIEVETITELIRKREINERFSITKTVYQPILWISSSTEDSQVKPVFRTEPLQIMSEDLKNNSGIITWNCRLPDRIKIAAEHKKNTIFVRI